MIREALQKWLGVEQRSADWNPAFAPGNWGKALPLGGYASPGAVLSNSSVAYRAIDLKATLLASTPLKVFHRLEGGARERSTNTALARALEAPNPYMTKFEMVELIVRCLDIHGNFFASIERDGNGQVRAFHPIHPQRVTVERVASGRLRYRVAANETDPARMLLDGEMWHCKGPSADGLLGQSAMTVARGSLGLALGLNEVQSSLAHNGLRPAFALAHPGKLSDRAYKNIKDSVRERLASGPGDVMILEEGMKPERLSLSLEDAQLLESRKLSNEDTARIFGVPPASVGIAQSVSYGSAAQAAQDLVTNTLNPLAARIEQSLERCVLSEESRRATFVEFDLSGLLRADPAERWRAYEIARRIGALNPNEIRALENLPPYAGGESYDAPKSAAPTQADPIASTKP